MSNPAIAARMGELIANESVQKALAVAKEEAPRALAEPAAARVRSSRSPPTPTRSSRWKPT